MYLMPCRLECIRQSCIFHASRADKTQKQPFVCLSGVAVALFSRRARSAATSVWIACHALHTRAERLYRVLSTCAGTRTQNRKGGVVYTPKQLCALPQLHSRKQGQRSGRCDLLAQQGMHRHRSRESPIVAALQARNESRHRLVRTPRLHLVVGAPPLPALAALEHVCL